MHMSMYVRYYNGAYQTLYVELIEYEDFVMPQLFRIAGDNQIYQRVNTDIVGSKKCYLCAFQHLTKHCYSAPTCSKGNPQYDYLTDRYLENSNRQCYYVIVPPPDIEYVAPEIESIQI